MEVVTRRNVEFLVQQEAVPGHPYWPGGLSSGITVGAGWDIGQHSKEELTAAWSKLDVSEIALLQRAAKKTGAKASQLLLQVKTVSIPREIAVDVLVQEIRQTYFPATAKGFSGLELLPAEAQIALISVVFNRGPAIGSGSNCFTSMEHARRIIAEWRHEYNGERRHSSLGNLTPEEYAAEAANRSENEISLAADSNSIRD